MVDNVIVMKYVKCIEVQDGSSELCCFRVEKHLGPFLIRASLFEGIGLEWRAKEAPLPHRPVDHNATKVTRGGQENANPVHGHIPVAVGFESRWVGFLVTRLS